MKKFLSLVLALVMTMSLVTVSAGAKDFTDDSKITYKDAVAVMSAVGVIDGYTDGSFQPTTNLTRGAAAKIICNLILGPTTAAALGADTAPYSDVPTSNVFAGYIAYCQKEGIISGYADGTFRPSAPLTGYAFMKMLLGALGYDSAKEGYTGANWSVNVAKQALAIGLADGNDDFVGQSSVNREEAMLYAFNTMDATMVEYGNDTTITVGDVVVSQSGKASPVVNSASKETIYDDNEMQFAERYFKDLTVDEKAEDAFNRPAKEWSFKKNVVTTIADKADLTYTTAVKEEDLYDEADMSASNHVLGYYVDGEKQDDYTVRANSDAKIGGNGVLVEVYFDKDEGKTVNRIIEINTYVGTVDDVDTNKDDERIVTVDGMDYVTEEFEEDDVVIYTKDANAASKDRIQSMTLVEKQTGELTKKVGDSEFTIGDTVYKASASEGANLNSVNVKDTVDFYLDQYGYIIKMDVAEENVSVDNLAYVEEADSIRGDYAVLRMADGSKKTVDTDKNYNSLEHYIVSFKENDDGTYKLTKRSTQDLSGAKAITFTKGNPMFNGTVVTNSTTTFLYKVDGDFKTYTGYKNAPSINADSAKMVVYKNNDGVAVLVYVELSKSDVVSSSADLTFVAYDSGNKIVDEGDDIQYYEYNAVVGGKITTVKVSSEVASLIAAEDPLYVNDGLKFDSDNIATDVSASATDVTTAASKISTAKNETITIGNKTLAYTDDVQVFFVDDAEISEGSINSIREDNNGSKNPYGTISYHVNEDGVIDIIVLVKK